MAVFNLAQLQREGRAINALARGRRRGQELYACGIVEFEVSTTNSHPHHRRLCYRHSNSTGYGWRHCPLRFTREHMDLNLHEQGKYL